MPKYLLAHDLGTSGNKATLFTTDGALVRSCVHSYPTRYYNGNWAEQNPDDWWRAVCGSTRELIREIDPGEICAVAFSGQMMGCLCVDASGTPLADSIIWADMRAQEAERYIIERVGAREFFRIAGHRPGASYTLAKFLWLRKAMPEVYRNSFKLLQAKDYMVYRLTGRFCTDYSDAGGTNAFDMNTFQWSDAILDAVDVPREVFPELVESTRVVGEVIAPMLDEYEIQLVMDPIGRGEANFIRTLPEGMEIVRAVNHPRVTLLADSVHLFTEREPAEDIVTYAPYLDHIHLCEAGRALPEGGISEGLAEILAAMRRIGYDKTASFEPMPHGLEAMKKALVNVKAALKG